MSKYMYRVQSSCHAGNKVSLIKIIHIVYIVFAEPTALAVFQHCTASTPKKLVIDFA